MKERFFKRGKDEVIEVVLDTNVLVAAWRSSLGASYRLVQTIEQRRWRPVISPTLAFEYEAVLKRGVPETGLTLQDVDDFDPDDDRILEVAVRT